MLLISDIHIGFSRSAGTTPKTQETLRTYLLTQLKSLLTSTPELDLTILGDLFDNFEVPARDWIAAYELLADWLKSDGLVQRTLTLVAGNHDHSDKGDRVSSFQMLCAVLQQQYPDNVQVIGINEYANVGEYCIALAHCSNQDRFNQLLDQILINHGTAGYLLLHANYDNNFAVNSDHSLNVSREQAEAFAAKGFQLVFAHEHQARTALGGKVVVLGNQWPTSVADCLNNDSKAAHIIDETIDPVITWSGALDEDAPYTSIDWRELGTLDASRPGFVRVGGDATRNESAEVITAIAKFRSKSEAFVVSNAVRVEGIVQVEELPKSFEVARKFDVMDFISKHLDERELAVATKLAQEKQ